MFSPTLDLWTDATKTDATKYAAVMKHFNKLVL